MIQKSENEIMYSWSGNRKPLVSVMCMTFNHKDYIEEAIDSLLEQITDFPFEIIIHDDCSNDGTAEIVQKYKKVFPNIICAFYEQENQHSNPEAWAAVVKHMTEKCSGKYVAFCEGDDHWLSHSKLQKQYDALQKHPDISICTSKTLIDFATSNKPCPEKYIPPKKFHINESRVITDQEMAELIFGKVGYPFHTSSFFCTRDFFACDKFSQLNKFTERDEIILRKAIAFGGVYYLDEVLSCYRWLAKDGWTKRYFEMSVDDKYEHASNQALANLYFDELTANQYHDLVCKKNFSILIKWAFLVDTKKVLYDIKTVVGEDACKNAGLKNKIIYFLAEKAPYGGKIIMKLCRKIRG